MAWKSDYGDKYESTKDSFIFSFKNNGRIENCILSRVKDEKKALHNSLLCGPSFDMGDLDIWKISWDRSTIIEDCVRKRSYQL